MSVLGSKVLLLPNILKIDYGRLLRAKGKWMIEVVLDWCERKSKR